MSDEEKVHHLYIDEPTCIACGHFGPNDDPDEPCAPPHVRAQALIKLGYHQVSRAYCTVARLPPGKSGKQALLEAANADVTSRPEYWLEENARWVARMSERDAGDQFLRVYASNRQLWLALDKKTFVQYLALGGGTYR